MSLAIRMTAEELIHAFGCSRRLATRIGALMTRQVGVSALVLEEAISLPELRELLLERSLLECADLAAELARLCTLPAYNTVLKKLPLVSRPEEDWQVIMAEEEALAGSGFATLASSSRASNAPLPSVSALPAVSTVAYPEQVLAGKPTGSAGELANAFSAQEVSRLRVDIFTGSESAQKVSALRQFAFTGVSAEEKTQVFQQALADADGLLRQAAVAGLRQFGGDADWSECLRLFAEARELPVALGRLRELAGRAEDRALRGRRLETGLFLLLGCLRDRTASEELLRTALEGLACVISYMEPVFEGWEDISRLLQERLLDGKSELLPGCRAVFAALEPVSGGRASESLLQEAQQTVSTEYRALLLDLLTGMQLPSESQQILLPLTVQTLCVLPLEHNSARFLRKAITDDVNRGLQLLAKELTGCDVAHQRAFVRFADNALHSYNVDAPTRAALAESCLQLLRSAPMQVRTDLIETRVLIRDDLPPELLRQTAELLLVKLRDYAQWPLCEYFENALVTLGEAAVRPLLTSLHERANTQAGAILARALGRIGATLPEASEALADDILRELSRLTFTDNKIMDALHLAMGMLAARQGVSEEVNALVMRTLLSRLVGTPADAALLRALGYCASGNIRQDCELPAIVALCLRHLETEQAAPTLQTGSFAGEETLTLGNEVEIYADLIPASLAGLEQILLGRRTPDELRESLLTRLIALWEASGALQVQWGPGNVAQLTEIFGRVGESSFLSDRQRVMLASALRRRANSLPTLQALAQIVALPSRLPQMDKLAAALAIRALERLGQPEAGAEDREAYLRLLRKVCERGRFEVSKGSVDRLWERIAQTVRECAQEGLNGATETARELLKIPALPAVAAEILRSYLDRLYALTNRTN